MHAFVHLSNIWGDDSDASGLRRDFQEAIQQVRTPAERALIVEIDAARAARIQSASQGEQNLEFTDVECIDWRDSTIQTVGVDLRGASLQDARRLDLSLRAAGFKRAGRAWGEAGQSRRYVRTTGLNDRAGALLAETKVRVGAAIVQVRDTWLSPNRREAWATRTRVRASSAITMADVLDDRYGYPLPPPPTVNARDLLPEKFGIDQPEWKVPPKLEPNPIDVAQECFDQHGVWPISFSYPKLPETINANPQELLAPIIPGFPYTFAEEGEYLRTYRDAYLGLTHRKAGWDCFRHVEILTSGAVPLMPDAPEIPEYAMVHYPKTAMKRVVQEVARTGGPPDTATRDGFRRHFEHHLTSQAMAEYVLEMSGLGQVQRVLFVDAALPTAADYLSVLTLIGLKQLLGSKCEVLHPVDYIYTDTNQDTQHLYGRGFGYTGILNGELRSATERGNEKTDPRSFDAVVVGSVARNRQVAEELRASFPAQRTIWIHGEDTPPTVEQAHELRSSGVHTFVRAIHTGRR